MEEMAIEDWDYSGGWEDDRFDMYVAEIVGGRADNEIMEALDEEFRKFGQMENIVYFRANNTASQRELVEWLGIDWFLVDMPWLLILEDEPENVEEGDQAIIFRLGDLEESNQVKDITRCGSWGRSCTPPPFRRSQAGHSYGCKSRQRKIINQFLA